MQSLWKKINAKGALFVRKIWMLVLFCRLLWTIICHLWIEKIYICFGNVLTNFEQLHTVSKYIPAENEIRKNKNSEDFLLNSKQVFSRQNLENLSGEYGR